MAPREWRDPRRSEHKESSGSGAAAAACGRIRSFAATRVEPNPDDLCRSSRGVMLSRCADCRDSGLRGVDAVTVSLGRLADPDRIDSTGVRIMGRRARRE